MVLNAGAWDVELTGTRLVIRTAPRDVFIDMQFKPPGHLHINRGRLLHNGVEVFIHPDGVTVLNVGATFSRCTFVDVPVGLALGHGPHVRYGVLHDEVPRYGIDRPAALRLAAEARRQPPPD